jgi:sterol 3beta-glucosyltransferase
VRRATLLAVGSQGDVEPCLALGQGLIAAGWSVRVAALEPFRGRAQALGLEFASLGELPAGFVAASPRPAFSGLLGRALFWGVYQRLLAGYLPAFEAACRDVDLIAHTGLAFPAYHLAEARAVPCVALAFVPGFATAELAHPLFAGRRLSFGARRNLASYAIEQELMVQSTAHLIAPWRRRLGLPPVPRGQLRAHRWRRTDAMLCAVSPVVLPRPTDWPTRVHQTGYLHAPSQPPDPGLRAFLAAGDEPVYVGFGSMSARDGERATRAVAVALGRLGLRGVLARGWGGLAGAPAAPHLHVTDAAPHDWLFERVRVVVHHGGAGTTAAALRAGRAAVVVPFDYDQRFWARLLADRGLGPEPLPREHLDARRLERALRDALDTAAYRERIAPIAAELRREDGVREAVGVLTATLGLRGA